jgi:hypothetical protein
MDCFKENRHFGTWKRKLGKKKWSIWGYSAAKAISKSCQWVSVLQFGGGFVVKELLIGISKGNEGTSLKKKQSGKQIFQNGEDSM